MVNGTFTTQAISRTNEVVQYKWKTHVMPLPHNNLVDYINNQCN